MFCTNCGNKLPDDALFCPECGEKVLPDDEDTMGTTGSANEQASESPNLSESENTDEDFAIPDIERTVILNSATMPKDVGLQKPINIPPEADTPQFSDGGTQILPNLNESTVTLDHQTAPAGEATAVLSKSSSPAGEETMILGNGDSPVSADTVVLDRPAASETPVREDTQAVFNDIQESLAHPDIDFEHSQGSMEPNGINETTVHMYGENAENNMGGVNGENEDPQFSTPQFDQGIGAIPPHGPVGMNGVSGQDGSDPGQKPKQKNKAGLIAAIVACAVVGIAVIIAVVLMFSSMGKKREEFEKQMNQGEEYMSDAEYEEAIEAFRKAIEIDDEAEDAYVGLADAYIKKEEYRKAAEVLQQGSKATGSKERIEEKKDELYELAPELKDEFENNNAQANNNTNKPSSQTQAPAPETKAPETNAPETTAPDETKPAPVTPDTTQPETTDPGTTDPGTTDPGTTDPGTTDPGTTDPGTTDPGTTDPGTTDPGTTDPGTTDPGTTDPGTTDPGTTDPGTTDPGNPDDGANPDEGDDGSGGGNPDDDGQGEIVVVGTVKYQMKEYYHETKLPNGDVGAYTQVKYPYFVDESKVSEALNAYMESVIKSSGTSEEEVKDYTGEEDINFPLYDKVVYEVTYGDHGLVSMKYTFESTHSATRLSGLIFSGSDGVKLGWKDVLNGSEDDLTALIQTYYKPDENQGLPVDEMLKRLSSDWNNCYLNEDGISFIASGDVSAQVLIPYSESGSFKFLDDGSTDVTDTETEAQQSTESEPPIESEPQTETDPETEASTAPQIQGASWIVEPSLEFEDVPVIMDDVGRMDSVVSQQFPLAVYKKDGKLGFINYDGAILTDPIYNMVYGCGSANNASYTLYASAAGNDIWSAAAVDVQTGQATGSSHSGHGGIETVAVYSRSDGKLYSLSFDGFSEMSNTSGTVMPVAVVDDINTADYNAIQSGSGAVYGLCSPEGVLDESHIFDHIYYASEGRMVVMSQGKYGVIDEAGNTIIPVEYDGAAYLDFLAIGQDPGNVAFCDGAPYPYSGGYIALKKDGKWGYFDGNGACVTDMVFEEARPVSQGRAFVKMDGKWGVIELGA